MYFKLTTDHKLTTTDRVLGVDSEHKSEVIRISVPDELADKWFFLEFETDTKEKYTTSKLEVKNGIVEYTVPNGLLLSSYLRIQAVLRAEDNWTWKSYIVQVIVRNSINVCSIAPEYPDFIGEAQEVLEQVTEELEHIHEVETDLTNRVEAVEATTEEFTHRVEEVEEEMESFEAAEASRVEAESLRQTNETTRQSNEALRSSAESVRAENEATRQEQETTRQSNETARSNAETTRSENEASRVSAESQRATAEGNRASAETLRVSQEETRQTNESSRVNAETLRVSAENTRASNESTRQSNESTRQTNESTRVSQEATREQNETTRIANEEARVQAETARATEFATWESEIDFKADKDYVDKKDINLQYEIADLKAKLYETVVGVKQLNTEYASEIDIPTHITEDSVAYPVLDNTAMEAATIKGHTLKWNSLYSINNFTNSTMNGINFTKNNDGSITINGTATDLALSSAVYANFTKGHKYLLKGCPSGGDVSRYFLDTGANIGTDFGNGLIGTCMNDNGTYYIRYYIKAGVTLNNVKVFPLLINLTEIGLDSLTTVSQVKAEILKRYNINIDTYQPYDAGSLKSVNVEKIESYTFNLLDNTTFVKGRVDNGIVGYAEGTSSLIITETGVTFTTTGGFRGVASGLVKINSNNNICINTIGLSGASCNLFVDYYDTNENWIGRVGGAIATQVTISTPPSNAYYVRISYQLTNAGTITLSEININYSNNSINGKYIPYKKLGSLTLPNIDLRGVNDIQDTLAFVEQEDGTYNLEHNELVENHIFTENDNWAKGGPTATGMIRYYHQVSGMKSGTYISGICSKFPTTNNITTETKESVFFGYSNNYIQYLSPDEKTLTEVRDLFIGVEIYYHLATPVKTVIATGLLFDEVSLLINKYGRIEVVNRSSDNVNADTTFNVAVKEFKDE